MIKFSVKPELHCKKHLGFYIGFGVRAEQDHRLLAYIPDVFCCRQQASAFVALCNAEQPELIHLDELIENAI